MGNLNKSWIDIVFENKNKEYGAYELRDNNVKTTLKSLFIGVALFSFLIATPMIFVNNKEISNIEKDTDIKIITVVLPPTKKEEPIVIPPKSASQPPVSQSRVDVVKFNKPVVVKSNQVTEDPPKMVDIIGKKIGSDNIKAIPDAVLTVETTPIIKDVINVVSGDDKKIYSTAGIEQSPEFPGGIKNFYKFVSDNFKAPEEEGLKGKVLVSFVVEKDGSLTDIKVIRDVGFGTDKEAIRVLKKSPKWSPGEQNGKKVRVQYSLPITIQSNF